MPSHQLNLTTEEINQILQALGQRPYIEVFQLISRIHEQVNGPTPQVASGKDTPVEALPDLANHQNGPGQIAAAAKAINK